MAREARVVFVALPGLGVLEAGRLGAIQGLRALEAVGLGGLGRLGWLGWQRLLARSLILWFSWLYGLI